MNKRLLTAILLLFIINALHAQDTLKYQFGVKLGGGISLPTTNRNFGAVSKEALEAGIWASDNIGKFSIQSELYFARTGGEFQNHDQPTKNVVYFNSFNLPVLAGYRFGDRQLNLHLLTGPMVSYHDAYNYVQQFYLVSSATSFINSEKFTYANWVYYWRAGVGLQYYRLSFDVNYLLELNNMNTNGYDQKFNTLTGTLSIRIF